MKKRSTTEIYYEERAKFWVSTKTDSFIHEEAFRRFEALLKQGDRVLDIGCAGGIHVPLFLGIGRKLKYEGMDLSQSMIDIAKSRYPQLEFTVGNILSFEPKYKISALWAGAVLMHIPSY
jgi:trans-aconitate methyltransferase